MALKPIDQRRPDESRAAIWAAIRALRTFSLSDLWEQTRLNRESIRDYLTGLQAAGTIERLPQDGPRLAITWQLAHDPGAEAPRVRRDGTAVTQGLGRLQLWRAMRVLKEFTALDLVVTASTEAHQVTEGEAKHYCIFLQRAGYLAVVRPGKGTGAGGTLTHYRFVSSRYSGPKPPMIQRVKRVYDPNLKKVVWQGGADDDQ